jgi:hypothetical protein
MVRAWKLNPAKSTTNSESRYKRVLLRIDPLEDGMSVVYDMVGTRGGITHMEWIGKLDGKDYPVQGWTTSLPMLTHGSTTAAIASSSKSMARSPRPPMC